MSIRNRLLAKSAFPAPAAENAAARRAATEQYARDLAAWEAKRDAAIVAIRAKLNDPYWQPRSFVALGIGLPPVNPNAGITITFPRHDL